MRNWKNGTTIYRNGENWRIPGTEEPSGLLSIGSHRVGHDWGDLATAATEGYRIVKWEALQIARVRPSDAGTSRRRVWEFGLV